MTIFVVDDSAVVRRMVAELLATSPDVVVVGEASSVEICVSPIEALAPDVVVMDWSMPGMNGIEATAELQRTRPDARVVGFTSTDDRRVHEAFNRSRRHRRLRQGARHRPARPSARRSGGRLKTPTRGDAADWGEGPQLPPTRRPAEPYAHGAATCHQRAGMCVTHYPLDQAPSTDRRHVLQPRTPA